MGPSIMSTDPSRNLPTILSTNLLNNRTCWTTNSVVQQILLFNTGPVEQQILLYNKFCCSTRKHHICWTNRNEACSTNSVDKICWTNLSINLLNNRGIMLVQQNYRPILLNKPEKWWTTTKSVDKICCCPTLLAVGQQKPVEQISDLLNKYLPCRQTPVLFNKYFCWTTECQ